MCQLNKVNRLIKAQICLNLYIRTHFWVILKHLTTDKI